MFSFADSYHVVAIKGKTFAEETFASGKIPRNSIWSGLNSICSTNSSFFVQRGNLSPLKRCFDWLVHQQSLKARKVSRECLLAREPKLDVRISFLCYIPPSLFHNKEILTFIHVWAMCRNNVKKYFIHSVDAVWVRNRYTRYTRITNPCMYDFIKLC